MKKLNVFLIAAMVLLGAQTTVFAQSKVAHINTTELVSVMPEMKAAEGQLEKLQKTYESLKKTIVTNFERKKTKRAIKREPLLTLMPFGSEFAKRASNSHFKHGEHGFGG